MQLSLDELIPKLRESLSERDAFDPDARRNPIQEWRYWQAVHGCAACARLLETSDMPFFRDLADGFAEMGRASPLAGADGAAAAPRIAGDIAALQRAAREACLAKIATAKLPVKLVQLRHLVQLGELDLAEAALADLKEASDAETFPIHQLLLRARGQWREAEANARRLFARDPDLVMQSGEGPRFLFTGNGGVAELVSPENPALLPLPTLLFHFDYLVSNDRFAEAIRLAQAFSGDRPIEASLAGRLRDALRDFDLPDAQQRDLAEIRDLPIMPIRKAFLDPKDWLAASVSRATDPGTRPATRLELSCWATSVLAVSRGGASADPLWELACPDRPDPVAEALRAAGYRPVDRHAARHQLRIRADGADDEVMSSTAIAAIQTERAARFLRESMAAPSGTILFSFHASTLPGRELLPTIAAARLGVPAMSIHAGFASARRDKVALRGTDLSQLPVRMIGRASATGAEITSEVIGHLRQGGLLDIAVDVVDTSGVTLTIPWFLRPISVPSYPATLAISLGCRIALSATWIAEDGSMRNDILEIDPPSEQGDLVTRSAWLLQKLGRAFRVFARQAAIPIASSRMLPRGGAAPARPMVPLHDWAARPATATSLVAWLGDPSHGWGRDALTMAATPTSFAALRKLTLRMASQLLHYQAEKPEHDAADRPIGDQHRVMLVLPQGPAFLASALAGLSVGCMVGLSQDDLAIEQLVQRYRDFRPDLVIATATVWARLQAAAPEAARQTVLIVADRGDHPALEQLVHSFAPAERLPVMRPNAPGLVIFTSGSTGKPKGVVHPCDALALDADRQGIGADVMLGLTPADRLTYVTRWDSVCFLDVLSSFRAGTAVCVPAADTLASPGDLGRWLTAQSVTCFSAPSTVFALLLQSDAMSRDRQPGLRLTMPWGERISAEVTQQLYRKFPDAAHVATYGASEALWVGFGPLPRAEAGGALAGPGGRLIPGVETCIVDDAGAPLPRGETGNPCVRGPGVMLGYLDEMMASAAARPGGPVVLQDFARLAADDTIELLGRSDSIVKIAGRRVSLIEIESAAELADGVKEAVAITDARGASAQVLIAVTRDGPADGAIMAAVSASVAERCFASARPTRVLVLQDFPRLPSGKRDRKAVEALLLQQQAPAVAVPLVAAAAPMLRELSPLLAELARWASLRFHRPLAEFDPDAPVPALDSLMVMELLLIAEDRFGAVLPGGPLRQDQAASWAELAAEIEHAVQRLQAGPEVAAALPGRG